MGIPGVAGGDNDRIYKKSVFDGFIYVADGEP